MFGIFWCKSLALTVFENIRVLAPIAKIETRHNHTDVILENAG